MDIVCLLIWLYQLFVGINAYLNNKEITPLLFICATLVCSIHFINLIVENKGKSKFYKIFDIVALCFWIFCTFGGIISGFTNKKVDVLMFIFAVIICIAYYIKRIIVNHKQN